MFSVEPQRSTFDHRARGTVFGSGAGAVALRRLGDAMADGDHIWAVLKGSAINNDGAAKAGYLAPSVDGQKQAITAALAAAQVPAKSVGMIECHGTGTYLGDPIEVAALTEAFRTETDAEGFCRIGSVKTNIGHLDTAAGVAGFAKAALALHHKKIPPSLGFETPNPAIAFDGSPFRVNTNLPDWPADNSPRRASVNALGGGGTNAHAIMEEAPQRARSDDAEWPFHPLVISGRSKAALDANTAALAAHLRAQPDQPLADVAYTLKEGRRAFDKRRIVVARSHEEAADLLDTSDAGRVFSYSTVGERPQVVFMFPGGGAQYVGMARDLYETEPVFAEWVDRGLAHLARHLNYDVKAIWLAQAAQAEAASQQLKKPSVQLPLIAIIEHALAKQWMSWGVHPSAMVGHSMGENVAACLAGVFDFKDLIDLVVLRGQLFDTLPEGGMLSIGAPLDAVRRLLGDGLDVACVNGPEMVVVSGGQAALEQMCQRLDRAGIEWHRIAIEVAAHSRMLDPILAQYRSFLTTLKLGTPTIDVISNRTGQPLTAQDAKDPDYWVDQLRNSVNFGQCIETLSAVPERIYVEVGPGRALTSLVQMNGRIAAGQVLSSLRHQDQDIEDDLHFLTQIGRLWACGFEADWSQIWGGAKRHRVVLPTYQFQRSSYFIEPGNAAPAMPEIAPDRLSKMSDWGALPDWQPRYADVPLDISTDLANAPLNWLVFGDQAGHAGKIEASLRQAGHLIISVRAGDTFAQLDETTFTLAPDQGRVGYDRLVAALTAQDKMPDRVAHFWLTDDHIPVRPGSSVFDRNMEQGFWSLTWLAQAIGNAGRDVPLHLCVFTTGTVQVKAEALPFPEKALIAGPLGVIGREVPGITCAQIDLEITTDARARPRWFARKSDKADLSGEKHTLLLEDLLAKPKTVSVAHRGARRYELGYRAAALPDVETPVFRDGGVYLITGGLGGMGLTFAEDILAHDRACVVLMSRRMLPPRAKWDSYLASHRASDPAARDMRKIMRLEDMASTHGGRVDVVCGDVTDLAQVRQVIDDITTRLGPLTGVLHAAGVLDDAPLLAKTDIQIEAVLAPKVQGLRVLDQLLPDGTLEVLALFSSISTTICPAGQVDYVAANAWLNAFAAGRREAKT